MNARIKNFFLTGKIGVGKTTVLNKILHDPFFTGFRIGGFRTERIVEGGSLTGYRFVEINGISKTFAHLNMASTQRFDRYLVDPSVFDDLGVRALKKAMVDADIIIMDEIGIIEKKALKFRDSIMQCLNSNKPVLGIYQLRISWLMEIIKDRTDIITFQITDKNRATIHQKITSQIIRNVKFLKLS